MSEADFSLPIENLKQIPDEDLQELIDSIRKGADTPAAALGFGPEALRAIEDMALGFYRGQLYQKAIELYSFITRLDPGYAPAWRGIGACAQCAGQFYIASLAYENALERDPSDVVSRVFLGESLCLLGKRDEGLKVLKEAVAKGTKDDALQAYLSRADAIIAQGGGALSRVVLMDKGKLLFDETERALGELGIGGSSTAEAIGPDGELHFENIKDEKLKDSIRELAKKVKDGEITYAQVGGFKEKDLDAVYKVACQYVEMGKVVEGLQIISHLMILDPYKGKYYQLVGICLQLMKQYEYAIDYYDVASELEPNNAMTLVYLGETKILGGEIDAGMVDVKAGIAAAEGKPEHKDVLARGRSLVQKFS